MRRKKSPRDRAYASALDTLDRTLTETGHEKCGRCAVMSFGPFLDGDTPELIVAANAVQSHAESGGFVQMAGCEDEACVFHEDIPFPLARRILKLIGAPIPIKGGAERKCLFDLLCRGNDRPAGFPGENAGWIKIRFTKRKATLHVCVDVELDDEENEEAWEGIRYPESFSKAWDLHFENCREWCLGKYREFRGLAEKNLLDEPPRGWEKGSPIKGPRKKA